VENLVPIPEGETLKSFGWRQDQSCYNGSMYFDTMHPVLSSVTNQLITATVDGYFSQWPAGSTVLVNRTKNREGTLLYYPYGEGNVILTSLYTDWGSSHSQATTTEIGIFRDLITFARNPKLPIPSYDLSENSNPAVSLNISVANLTEEDREISLTAASAKLYAYSADGTQLLHQDQLPVALNPGESGTVNLEFVVPSLSPEQYGICTVYYELYDDDGHIIQLPTFAADGRFAVYNLLEKYVPPKGIDMWLTVEKDEVYIDEQAVFTLHIKNHSKQAKTIACSYIADHRGIKPLFTLTVPAEETLEQVFSVEETNYTTLTILTDEPRRLAKNLEIVELPTNLVLTSSPNAAPGEPIKYEISTASSVSESGNFHIRAILEKYDYTKSGYDEMLTLLDREYDLNGPFHYEGEYSPDGRDNMLQVGRYRIKLEILSPKKSLCSVRSVEFYQQGSRFGLSFQPIQQNGASVAYLAAGAQYTLPVTASNNNAPNNYAVQNGNYLVTIESESGVEIFRKAVSGITVNSGETKILEGETFTFNPLGIGTYYLKAHYWDETEPEQTHSHTTRQTLYYRTHLSAETDKTVYDYLDNARVSVRIGGNGTYTVQFTCAAANLTETRTVTLEGDTSESQLTYSVPIGLKEFYGIHVTATAVNSSMYFDTMHPVTSHPVL